MKEIPLLKDVGLAKREALFMQKVELCTTVYRFENEMAMGSGAVAGNNIADTRGKEVKRQTLMELLDFVNTHVSRKCHMPQTDDDADDSNHIVQLTI